MKELIPGAIAQKYSWCLSIPECLRSEDAGVALKVKLLEKLSGKHLIPFHGCIASDSLPQENFREKRL